MMMKLEESRSSGDKLAKIGGWTWRRDIANREGDVYLTRFRFPLPLGHALMLHIMRRPDQDRCLHDHPWWFVTLVLWGGYEEEVETVESENHSGPVGGLRYRWTRWNRPGTLLYRSPKHTHRVSHLPKGKAVTLVMRGPYRRVWGFRNALGEWRPWNQFVDWAGSVLWCDERPESRR